MPKGAYRNRFSASLRPSTGPCTSCERSAGLVLLGVPLLRPAQPRDRCQLRRERERGVPPRPELFRLLADCRPGDVLLVEQVDRLSRLNDADWEKLKREIKDREVKVVALDLPTSHMVLKSEDAFTGRMFEAVNGMMLDMLAAIARKDYEDRRRRQAQGIARAKAEGRMKGRRENVERNKAIAEMLRRGQSWTRAPHRLPPRPTPLCPYEQDAVIQILK